MFCGRSSDPIRVGLKVSHGGGVVEFVQQLLQAVLEHGVLQVGRELAQGHEHEATLMQAGVWEMEAGFGEDEGAVEEQIEIEGAWAVGLIADAAAGGFDAQEFVQEIARGEGGFERGGGVEEGSLIGEADGFGFIERGDAAELAEALQAGEGGLEMAAAVAEV